MSNFEVFTCPCCDTEFLVDYKARTFEMLGFNNDEPTEAPDDDYLDEDDDDDYDLEVTAEPEPGLDGSHHKPTPNANHSTPSIAETYGDAYKEGRPVVPGKQVVNGGRTEIVNKPSTQHGSGISVVTTIEDNNPKRSPKPKQKFNPQPLGELKNVVRPKSKAPSRDGFEVTGSDASQDFTGLTGADGHFDNLLQSAYENDLQSRGF